MTAENKNKEKDSRAWDEERRDAQIKEYLRMDWKSPLSIDKNTIPEDQEYCFFNDSIMGTPTPHVIEDARRRGFEMVTADERPDLVAHLRRDDRQRQENNVRYREMILFRRKKEYADIEREALRKKNKEILDRVPGQSQATPYPINVLTNKTEKSFG